MKPNEIFKLWELDLTKILKLLELLIITKVARAEKELADVAVEQIIAVDTDALSFSVVPNAEATIFHLPTEEELIQRDNPEWLTFTHWALPSAQFEDHQPNIFVISIAILFQLLVKV